MLSVIIPAFNEENMVQEAANRISVLLKEANIPYEILFINDGSTDRTWEQICTLSSDKENIRGICFSRNFGKESAIFAGLEHAVGECVVVIDCDLQHPPQKIIEMYRLWQQGYEVIEGVKADRGQESMLYSLAARCFYKILSKATQIDMERASDFKLLDRKAVNVLLNMRERNAFFRALSSWIGFRTTSVEFEVGEREQGTTKWTTWSLMKYAISNITSFSAAPMQIVTILGAFMLIVALVLGAIALTQKIKGIALGGFTTVIIIQLFIGSIVMISLGIIGYYIAQIYDELKGRPRYIVSGQCGESKEISDR
ncbi:MAG: glycosyltransferase family 2 protein [Lachnospiraceae bacterium]|nr:glycosyltransferase family 2 protein [Lachnospiraceae bacterium]